MCGRKVLLILDDLWDDINPLDLMLVDTAAGSFVLLSSRVRGALLAVDCDVMNIGLPSDADAIGMVMAAAGMPQNSTIPIGTREIACAICKRLPLSLGMAGRLVREMDMPSDDWTMVVELMKEEQEGAAGEVNAVIATSLKAMRGPNAAAMTTLLAAFGLAAEDVKVPLEALLWMMEASSDEQPPTMAQLRRMTKALIDRALILGPVDAPQLHG